MSDRTLKGNGSEDPSLIGVEWVRAHLDRDPRTRHLNVTVSAQRSVLVLEGRVASLSERALVDHLARRYQFWGSLDNRVEVFDGCIAAMAIPSSVRRFSVVA